MKKNGFASWLRRALLASVGANLAAAPVLAQRVSSLPAVTTATGSELVPVSVPSGKNADGTTSYVSRNVSLAQIATRRMPVCNTHYTYQTGGASGSAAMARTVFYCPQGARNIRLILPGTYAGAAETSFNLSIPAKLSAAVEPSVWSPTKTYAAGDKVSWYPTSGGSGSYANNPYWIATAGSTNSPPKPGNANWTPGSRPATTLVTVSGLPDATLPTQTMPDGTVVTKAQLITDDVPVSVPVGGYLTVYSWIANTNGTWPTNLHSSGISAGGSFSRGTSQADQTAASGGLIAPQPATANWFSPVGVIGTPIVATPSVVVLGDSISDAVAGGTGAAAATIVAGGSGYAVGDIVTADNTGSTPGALAAGCSAKWIVDAVSSGAISSLRMIDTGCYTSTSSQTGQTLPTGTQNAVTLSGSGTGATFSFATSGNPFEAGDPTTLAQGWVQRGLATAGIPHLVIASAGDRANLYAARSYSRMALVAASGAQTAVIALGNNDVFASGDSATTVEGNLVGICLNLKAMGVRKVLAATITPGTSSTTVAGQTTLADQIVPASDAARQAVNLWERSSFPGTAACFDGVIDDAALVENGGASAPTGKWDPISGLPAAADGKHPGTGAVLKMAPAVTTAAASGLLN